ncbi:kinase-like domain-containing protein [Mycena sanguinolenta]|nr:kinase-like domain-containing protein [Mycena sanguinolenta]
MTANPAFPSLRGLFHDRENYYLVMDCGCTPFLEVAIPSRKVALSYGRRLAGVLQALHERGVVHADLKEENILLGADGRLMIIDFGLVHVFPMPTSPAERFPRWHALAEQARREPGVGHFPLLWPDDDNPHHVRMRGWTPGYMSPEVERGELCSYGVDLFAFGAILRQWLGHSGNADSKHITETELSFLTRITSSSKSSRFESWEEILEHPFWSQQILSSPASYRIAPQRPPAKHPRHNDGFPASVYPLCWSGIDVLLHRPGARRRRPEMVAWG